MNSVLLQPTTPIFINTNENVNIDFPNVFNQSEMVQIKNPPIQLPPPPKYGCLKNGSLPTYKFFHRQTQRVNPEYTHNTISTPIQSYSQEISAPLNFLEKYQSIIDRREPTEIIQKYEKTQKIFNDKSQKRIKYLKRKKIFKRTYHVGRSNTKPQIGVLVSNRTIRNRISTEAQLLKQTPIRDVRKFLIKKGFIKIGTNAPNDVLRKMYESVSLVCGEIQNHNPENLLFNFIHDTTQ